jgi:hypothetical protein
MNWSAFFAGAPSGFAQGATQVHNWEDQRLKQQEAIQRYTQLAQMNPLLLQHQQLQNQQLGQNIGQSGTQFGREGNAFDAWMKQFAGSGQDIQSSTSGQGSMIHPGMSSMPQPGMTPTARPTYPGAPGGGVQPPSMHQPIQQPTQSPWMPNPSQPQSQQHFLGQGTNPFDDRRLYSDPRAPQPYNPMMGGSYQPMPFGGFGGGY